MNLREANYIQSIYKNKNITKAAAKLFISQPSLSRCLQNIENRLGFPIFYRSANEYLPTYNGKRYLNYARRILQLEKEWKNEYRELKNEDQGELTIAIPLMRSSCMIPETFINFHKVYPNVKLKLWEETHTISHQLLLNEDIDFAIYNPTEFHSCLEYIPLREEPFLLVCSANNPLTKHAIVNTTNPYPLLPLEKCKDQQFILHVAEQHSGKKALNLLKAAEISPNILLQTHSSEVALSLAASGLGLAFAPESYVLKMKKALSLSCFSIGDPLATVQLMAVYRKGKFLPNYAKYYLNLLK